MTDSAAASVYYTDEEPIDTDQFVALLQSSGLAARRPTDERARIASMVLNADIMMTAWAGTELIGVARSVTDFAFCCYLSDLAVSADHQRRGIGRELVARSAQLLAPQCQLILLSAPDAQAYYPELGFEQHDSAWVATAQQLSS